MARRPEREHQHRRDEQRAQQPCPTRNPHVLRLNAIGMPVKGAKEGPRASTGAAAVRGAGVRGPANFAAHRAVDEREG
jgi:hypothetical protein